ncbi:MAG: hypothetical protein QXI12_00405 [Candidatus Methanomethyliaceae archaeon]
MKPYKFIVDGKRTLYWDGGRKFWGDPELVDLATIPLRAAEAAKVDYTPSLFGLKEWLHIVGMYETVVIPGVIDEAQ